ncbi:MAG: type IV pilin protein, partial [Candidatus Acidiferrales bacterium]
MLVLVRSLQRRRATGFALPELMLVLAIIMVLVSLAVPRYMSSIQVAEEAKAAQTMKNIHTAQEAYRITNGAYAPTFDQLKNTTPLAGAAPSQTGSGAGGEDVMVYQGYIFRLKPTAPDAYTVQAEPVRDRNTRRWWSIDQQGNLLASLGQLAASGGGSGGGGSSGSGTSGSGSTQGGSKKKQGGGQTGP